MEELQLAYLITGTDRPKIETAIRRLRRHFDESSVETVSAPETPAADVVALCNAGSLFGDRRLVVVDEIDGRANADGRLGGGWKTADVEVITTYLADPAPTTVLALVARDLKPDSALGKSVNRAGAVLEYGFAPRKLVPWVAERFRQHGVKADGDACQALIELVGDDPYGLAPRSTSWRRGRAATRSARVTSSRSWPRRPIRRSSTSPMPGLGAMRRVRSTSVRRSSAGRRSRDGTSRRDSPPASRHT